MSRVYMALEKAEKEKQVKTTRIQPIKEEPIFEILEANNDSDENGGAGLKDLSKEIEKFDFPNVAEESILVASEETFAAEQFRKIKTFIFRITPNPPRIILVTSTVPQEGKSTITMNLAISIAQEFNKKVIVIDADLRKPSIYPGKFNNRKGLSDFLLNDTPIADILKSFGSDKLMVIPAGSPSHKAAELISSKKMKDLITNIRGIDEETFILIDSPPILSTSEPLMLSEWVDGVIMVVMADQANRGSIKKAVGAIDTRKIIGIIFNRKKMKSSKGYPDYYYSYRDYKKIGK
jgi:protein-tyrosine kinase